MIGRQVQALPATDGQSLCRSPTSHTPMRSNSPGTSGIVMCEVLVFTTSSMRPYACASPAEGTAKGQGRGEGHKSRVEEWTIDTR